MKRSLIICTVIVTAAGLLGWREKQRISTAKEMNSILVRKAAEIAGNDGRFPEFSEQRRENFALKEKVKNLGRDFFALYRDTPEKPDDAFLAEQFKATEEMKIRVGELDPAGIRLLMDECTSNPDLNVEIRRALNNFVQQVFIQKYPIEMARMMAQSPEQFGIGDETLTDPFAYLVYYYSGQSPDLPTVFQCLAEAPPEFQSKYIGQATKFATNTPARRAELLEEMRSFAITPEQKELVKGQMSDIVFGRPEAKGSFTELSDWIASANLSSEELVAATRNIENNVRVGEAGQWLDWLEKREVPDVVSRERAFDLAARWAEKDYQAAGQWLNSAPDSPVKSAVASAYAIKSYPYDPEGARQWIQTLPQGPDRVKALETIYQAMPKGSIEAEAFADEFGLSK